MTDLPAVHGLILSGGKSSRMGEDKSLIDFHGLPQREYLFRLLSRLCVSVHLSCKNSKDVPPALNPLQDLFEIESPLNGILSAFSHDANVSWLTLPVDMPLVDERVLKVLLEHRHPSCVGTCYLDSDNRYPEPLICIWEPTAFPLLMEFYNGGNISPRKFLMQNRVNVLKYPDAGIFANINTPEELRAFRKNNSLG